MLRRLFTALLMGLALAPSAQAACPDDVAVARFAGQVLQRQSPTPFIGLSAADGRCVQEKLVAIFAQPLGDVVGFKLGLTNPAIQQRVAAFTGAVDFLLLAGFQREAEAEGGGQREA